jgi:hypothetical protein
MAFSILNREQQQVFLGSGQVFAVQNVSASYSIPEKPLEFIGISESIPIPNAAVLGSIEMNTLGVSTDPFIKYIKSGHVNGYILEERDNITDNYSFYSGFLTSYSNHCTVGQIPQIAASFRVLGDIGRIPTGEFPTEAVAELDYIQATPKEDSNLNVAAASSVEITLDDFTTNLVSDYAINISIPRKDYYRIGKREAHRTEVDFPVIATTDFTIEVNDYSGNTAKSYPCKQKLKDFDIKLKNYQDGNTLTQFSFTNLTLISESYSVGVDENVKITARYRGYISNLDVLNENLNTPELVTTTN